MLFKPRHIELIREGVKTATRRDWKDQYARPNEGSIVMAVPEMFATDDECDCYIRVESIYQQPLGEMTQADAVKEGGYTLRGFRDEWEQINGADSWSDDLVVDVVEFEYVGRERPDAIAAQDVTDDG